MAELTLEMAQGIVKAATDKGVALKCRPLTVAVLDAAGLLKAFARQDGPVALLRPDIAIGKAWGALAMGGSTRGLADRLHDRPQFMSSLIAMAGGRLVPVPGGVLILDQDGTTMGAVGVSGDTSDNDEAAAVAGIRSAGFNADVA